MRRESVGNEKKKNTSEHFFETLDRRVARRNQNVYRFRIKICGYIIELRFPSKEDAERVERDLVGQICCDKGKEDAVFQFWTDDYNSCIGVKDLTKRYEYNSKDGYMLLVPSWMLIGVNLTSRTFYYCRPEEKADVTGYGIIALFYLWAKTKDMLVLHGAAVGVNGRGVLIAAQGGGGKSTLSVSCLLQNMDFVSDDHLLVNRFGSLQAMPLYKTIKLNPDMMEQIRPEMPVIWTDDSRGGKKTMDASNCDFSPRLPIKALISPMITDGSEPTIHRISAEPVLNQLIQSTLQQIGTYRNFDAAQAIIVRFCGMPVYELQLCKDLSKNVELLRRFIEREM